MRTLFGILTVVAIAIGMSACSQQETSSVPEAQIASVETDSIFVLPVSPKTASPYFYLGVGSFEADRETPAFEMQILGEGGVSLLCIDLVGFGADSTLDYVCVIVEDNCVGLGQKLIMPADSANDSLGQVRDELNEIYRLARSGNLCGAPRNTAFDYLYGVSTAVPTPPALTAIIQANRKYYRPCNQSGNNDGETADPSI